MTAAIKGELLILLKMLRGRSRNGTHQQQLEDFYKAQAECYDSFRERLLHGRRELIEQMQILPENTIVELGGGTGRNLHYLEYPLQQFRSIEIVDLCSSLLAVARRHYGDMKNIRVVEADATIYRPEHPVDRVLFSYALTMIPDWKKAINNAIEMLKPGGLIGVVDFYVSDNKSDKVQVQHNYILRKFWQTWFGHDGVRLTAEHLQYMHTVTEMISLKESRGKVPYLPLLKAPYYFYVGQKIDPSRARLSEPETD